MTEPISQAELNTIFTGKCSVGIEFPWGPEFVEGEWLPDRTFELSAHAEQIPLVPGDIVLATDEDRVIDLYYTVPVFLLEVGLLDTATEDQRVAAARTWHTGAQVTITTRTSARISCPTWEWLNEHVVTHPIVTTWSVLRAPGDTLDFDELMDDA